MNTIRIRTVIMLLTAGIAICCFTGTGYSSSQIPSPPQKQPIALVGGTIHTVGGETIEQGIIVFDKGVITDIGKSVPIPSDAITIDITGKHVYPSLIECNSDIGLVEIYAVSTTVDVRETGEFNPNVRAETAMNPDSEYIPVTRSNGIGLAAVCPSGGLVSGKVALMMLDGWTWEAMTLKAPVGMIVNWPAMGATSAYGKSKRSEQQLTASAKQIEKIESFFTEARAYMSARKAAGEKGIPFHKTDVRYESLIPVLKGELPVWVYANSIQQIEAAIEWTDREGIRMVLVGGADAPLAIDLLKRKNIPVIVTPVLRLPNRPDEAYDEPFTVPLKLYEAGVVFCIANGSDGYGNARNLPYQAGMAAAFGLPGEIALKAVTQYPAEILGVSKRVGTLEKGKDATLIITTGDPLEITTQVERLFIQGRDVDLNNKQKTLYSKYREKYRQIGGN